MPFAIAIALSPQHYLGNWPTSVDPRKVGKMVAERFVVSPHQYHGIVYSEIGTWYGALAFAQLTGDNGLRERLVRRFDPLLPRGGETHLIGGERHVDDEVFGVVPLEIGIQIGDDCYLEYGKRYADRQWESPRPDGLSGETRYWIDDMYMITILQLQAFRATDDRKYLDRAGAQMAAYLDKLQQHNGLFYHALDVPFFWGRGNGWAAVGMAEILKDLPADHCRRPAILRGYERMMRALLEFQGEDGMWRQLIDDRDCWPESSGSGMFTFALISGVRNGWLDPAIYGPAARRAWIAVVGHLDENGAMTNVCEGTNKLNSRKYYLERQRRTGDFHGQGPILWAASELLRLRDSRS